MRVHAAVVLHVVAQMGARAMQAHVEVAYAGLIPARRRRLQPQGSSAREAHEALALTGQGSDERAGLHGTTACPSRQASCRRSPGRNGTASRGHGGGGLAHGYGLLAPEDGGAADFLQCIVIEDLDSHHGPPRG